jgi:hypothetical protein
MSVNLRLKLLELTNSYPTVNLNELDTFSKRGRDETLVELTKTGLVTLNDGVLTLDGRQRVMLAEQLIHGGIDAKRVSRMLGWQEFEDFADRILSDNEFFTHKHLVFKSSMGRREIDILAWNDTLMLAVDCKHWLKGLSAGRMKQAARAQTERTIALARRPELLHRLKVPRPDGRSIIPVILALGDLRERLIDGVPIVSVSKLLSFIYGVSPLDPRIERIRVQPSSPQSRLA